MAPAAVTLVRYGGSVSVHDPRTRLISNRDGDVVATGRQLGVAMPGLIELGPTIEAWSGGPTAGSGPQSTRQPMTAR